MKKLFISAGHSAVKGLDMGAAGNGYIEGVEANEFRNLLNKELKDLGINAVTDNERMVLVDVIKEFKKTSTEDSILVEFHFNSSTPQATGAETLIPNNPTKKEQDIAKKINDSISETLGIRNRGVKTEAQSARGSLGFMRLAGSNILPEICFISNKDDMAKYRANRVQLAKNIAKILAEEVKETVKTYTVKAGDTLSKIAINNNTTIAKLKKDNKLSSDLIQIGQKLIL